MEIALKRLVKVFCPLQLSYHSVSVVVECVVSCHCAFAYLAGTSSAHQSYHPVVDHELFGSSVGCSRQRDPCPGIHCALGSFLEDSMVNWRIARWASCASSNSLSFVQRSVWRRACIHTALRLHWNVCLDILLARSGRSLLLRFSQNLLSYLLYVSHSRYALWVLSANWTSLMLIER